MSCRKSGSATITRVTAPRWPSTAPAAREHHVVVDPPALDGDPGTVLPGRGVHGRETLVGKEVWWAGRAASPPGARTQLRREWSATTNSWFTRGGTDAREPAGAAGRAHPYTARAHTHVRPAGGYPQWTKHGESDRSLAGAVQRHDGGYRPTTRRTRTVITAASPLFSRYFGGNPGDARAPLRQRQQALATPPRRRLHLRLHRRDALLGRPAPPGALRAQSRDFDLIRSGLEPPSRGWRSSSDAPWLDHGSAS